MAIIRSLLFLLLTVITTFSASPNDLFANRARISGSSPFATDSWTGATVEPGEPHQFPASLWWQWTSPTNSGMSFESPNGPAALVYTGEWPNLELVSAPAPIGNTRPGYVSFRATQGTTYYLAAAGPTNFGIALINIRLRPAPANDDFTNATSVSGTNLNLSVAFRGSTFEPDEPLHATNAIGSLWWKWSPGTTNRLLVETLHSTPGFEPAIYSGDSITNLILVSAPPRALPSGDLESSRIDFHPTEQSYFIALSQSGSQADELPRLAIRPWPRNDAFANPIVIQPLTNASAIALFYGATAESGEPGTAGISTWFEWTSPVTGSFAISAGSSTAFNPAVEIYTGDALTNLTLVSPQVARLGVSLTWLRAVAGTTYRIRAVGDPSATGNVTIQIRPGPTNDDLANAIAIEGSSFTSNALFLGATTELGETVNTNSSGATLWWTFTPTNSGAFSFDAVSSPNNVLLDLYHGDSISNLTLLASAANGNGLPSARITLRVTAGESLHLRVSDANGFQGNGSFTLSIKPAPANDDFANAPLITTEYFNGTTRGATSEPGEPLPPGGGQSVWYRWKPPSTGGFEISLISGEGANILSLYDGTAFENLQLLARVQSPPWNDASTNIFADSSRIYYLSVNNLHPGGDAFQRIRFTPAVSNDDFDRRAPINMSFGTFTYTHGSIREPGEPLHDSSAPPRTLWFEWTCEKTGGYFLSLSSPNIPGGFVVYQGTNLTTLQTVPSHTTVLGWPTSYHTRTMFRAVAGEKYAIVLWDHQRRNITFQFSETAPNDDFANAEIAQEPLKTYDVEAATLEPYEPATRYTIPTVWHKFTPPISGSYVVQVSGGHPVVYRGTSLSDLTLAERSATNAPTAISVFSAASGEAVYIAIHLSPPATYSLQIFPAEENDNFEQRIPLVTSSWVVPALSTVQTNEPVHTTNFLAGTLWWKWTPTNSGIHRIQALGPHRGAALAVYNGTDLTNLTVIARADAAENESPFLDISAEAGLEYSVASTLIPWSANTILTLEIHTPPANDSFEFSQPLSTGETNSQSFVFATRETDEEWAEDKETLWYSWLAPFTGTAVFVTDTEQPGARNIGMFTGQDPTNLTIVASLDHSLNGALAFQAESNTTYRIAVAVQRSVSGRTLNTTIQLGHPNDAFITPVHLSGHFVSWTNTTFGSTSEPFEASLDSMYPASIWAQWTAPESALYRILLNFGSVSVLALGETAGLHLVSTNVWRGVEFTATAGVTYYIRVAAQRDLMGPFSLRLGPPPPNENENFPILLVGDNIETNSQNWVSSLDVTVPHQGSDSVWYRWVAPAHGVVSYSVSSNLLNPSLYAFHGKSPTIDSNLVAPNRWSTFFQFPPPRTNFAVTENISYLFGIRGSPSTNFNFRLNFTPSSTMLGLLSDALLGGDHLWFSQTNVFYTSPEALQAGPISTNGEAWIELTFHGRGTLRFRTKLQGDGNLSIVPSPSSNPTWPASPLNPGEHNWTLRTIQLYAPTNVVRISASSFPRLITIPVTAWLDDIEFVPEPPQQPNLIFSLNPNDPDQLRLSFQLEANRATILDVSTNLTDWLPFTNLLSPTSTFRSLQFPIPTNGSPQFFRARIEP